MNDYTLSKRLEKILRKVRKKDRVLYLSVLGKIEEVIGSASLGHYKNLR